MPRTVLTKNQCFATVSASKKNVAPADDWSKKSDARVAIHLKIEKPAPDLRTKRATACWMNNPTMTVGLENPPNLVVWYSRKPRMLTKAPLIVYWTTTKCKIGRRKVQLLR